MIEADDHGRAGFQRPVAILRNFQPRPVFRACGRRADLFRLSVNRRLEDLQGLQPALRCFGTGVINADVTLEFHAYCSHDCRCLRGRDRLQPKLPSVKSVRTCDSQSSVKWCLSAGFAPVGLPSTSNETMRPFHPSVSAILTAARSAHVTIQPSVRLYACANSCRSPASKASASGQLRVSSASSKEATRCTISFSFNALAFTST